MELSDFSPSQFPSPEAQRDALQKGLGRAWQWARSGQLSTDLLLDACLNDKRFDGQCEENRGGWLWELINELGCVASFRQPLLEHFSHALDERQAHQHCELIFQYAETGDGPCREALWRFVENGSVAEAPWVGVGQLLLLCEMDAFEMITRIRGKSFLNREWDWHDSALVQRASELFGEAVVRDFLLGGNSPEITRFASAWKAEQQASHDGRMTDPRDQKMASTAEQVIQEALTTDNCRWIQRWGFKASDSEVQKVAEALWQIDNPEVIRRLLWVFARRAMPEFDKRLLELCQHEDEEIKRLAFRASANNGHPSVRTFAIDQLTSGSYLPSLQLFAKNFRSGDEQLIFNAIEIPADSDDRHGLLIDILHVIEENTAADVVLLGQVIYLHTPCTICRTAATKVLLQRKQAPQWLIEEVERDADEDARELVKEVL